MKSIFSLAFFVLFTAGVLAEEAHDEHTRHDEHEDHNEHKGEDHNDDHDHDEHEKDEDGHGDHHEGEAFGENKAIVEVMDDGNKFQLHSESIKFLSIRSAAVTQVSESEFLIPPEAVVRFQNHTGVYRLENEETFEMLHIEIIKDEGKSLRVKNIKLKPGDRVAVSKLGNLRAAQLQASGQGGQGHAH